MPVTVNENRAFGLSSKLNVLPSFDGTMGRVIGYGKTWGLPEQFRNILRKYGATLLMPGPAGILQYGFRPGNYRESTGQTLAAVDQQVGFVVDAAQSPGPELMTNGDFSNGLTGWSSIGTGGTRTVVSGRVQITGGTGPGLRQGGLISGRTYRASMYARRISGTANAFVTGGGLNPAGATVTWVFNASATNFDFGISGDSSTTTWEFGEISVRELPGIHASQPTSGFQPYLRQSGVVNSWQFDGTDDRLSLSAVPFGTSDDFVMISGCRPAAALDMTIIGLGNSGQTNPAIVLGTLPSGQPRMWARNDAGTLVQVQGPSSVVGSDVVLTGRKNGSVMELRVNGVAAPTAAWPANSMAINTATLGALTRTTVGGFFSGHMHPQIMINGAPSDAEIGVLERFIARWQGRNL